MISVETTTLDDIIRDIDHVNVVKLDLEGAELLALQGASRLLRITDAILYETASDNDDLDVVFRKNGFMIRRIDGLNKVAERALR